MRRGEQEDCAKRNDAASETCTTLYNIFVLHVILIAIVKLTIPIY